MCLRLCGGISCLSFLLSDHIVLCLLLAAAAARRVCIRGSLMLRLKRKGCLHSTMVRAAGRSKVLILRFMARPRRHSLQHSCSGYFGVFSRSAAAAYSKTAHSFTTIGQNRAWRTRVDSDMLRATFRIRPRLVACLCLRLRLSQRGSLCDPAHLSYQTYLRSGVYVWQAPCLCSL